MNHSDEIVRFYADKQPVKKRPLEAWMQAANLSNTPHGLGDCMIMSWLPDLAKKHGRDNRIWSNAPIFQELSALIPSYLPRNKKRTLMADVLQRDYNMGNGHFIQRLHRAIGFTPPVLPHGLLHNGKPKKKNLVALHLVTNTAHAEWQRTNVHPSARMISAPTAITLQKFIHSRPDLTFIEIGKKRCGFLGMTENGTGDGIERMHGILSECEFFIGIMSGPMHVATALGCKCIVIINFPAPELIYLPTLKDIDQVESEWFYPQHVHLHQEGDGPLVKQITLYNLQKALDGEIYPYWDNSHLPLIYG